MVTYNFEKFNYADQDIILGSDTIFYRGVDPKIKKKNIIRHLPMYIGPEHIAKEYGKTYKIQSKKPLKLVDVRKLKCILQMVILSRKSNEGNILQSIRYLTIAFGLCSYVGQVKLLEDYVHDIAEVVDDKTTLIDIKKRIKQMKQNYSTDILNPFEPEGVRIAETTIDGKVMLILKELFKGIYDGFIAPKMWSPFHTGHFSHEEIVIFDPIESMLYVDETTKNRDILTLEETLDNNYKSFHVKDLNFHLKLYTKGGGRVFIDKNTFFEKENKTEISKAKSEAKLFKTNVDVRSIKFRKPHLRIFG